MLSTYTTKYYTGEGPLNNWYVVFKDDKPIFASSCVWDSIYGSGTVSTGLRKRAKEELAQTILSTDVFQRTVQDKVDAGVKNKNGACRKASYHFQSV